MKEAIALLEKARNEVDPKKHIYCQRDINACDYIDQALSILQQPKAQPSSEFTKRIRTEPYNPKWEHTLIIRTEDRDELCDRLDKSEASRKELKELLLEYGRHQEGCPAQYDKKYPCRCGWDREKSKGNKI